MQNLYVKSKSGFSLQRSGIRGLKGRSITWTKEKEEKLKQSREEAIKFLANSAREERKRREQKEKEAAFQQHAKPSENEKRFSLVRESNFFVSFALF